MSVTLCTVESGINVSKAGQRDIALKSGTVPRKTGRWVGMRLTQAHCLCFKTVLRSIGSKSLLISVKRYNKLV